MNTPKELRLEIAELERQLASKKLSLAHLIRNCVHRWSAPVADHVYHKGYTIPGDPPGVGGSDHQFPCYVEPKTEKRWKRTCPLCGEIQYTSDTTKVETEVPRFR